MNLNASKKDSIKQIDNFILKNQLKYSYLRNFDFGLKDRSNTSCISPYISHGILTEVELLERSLKINPKEKIDKFIQEVLWRIYWKGWLELRPNVWSDYLQDLKNEKSKNLNNIHYLNAINANTEIECFNDWVKELRSSNYLHNHARMWFASIWIFTLKLPWELGAEFFLENLFDGDPASNTLSWRWVAGIQTVGKYYLAKKDNIRKYTNNKYRNIILEENAEPIKIKNQYSVKNNTLSNPEIYENKSLIIFDNNLSFETSDFSKINFKNIFIVENNSRKLNLSKNVKLFKNKLIKDQHKRLGQLSINSEIIQIDKLKYLNEESYALYPCIGDNLDFLIENKIKNIRFLYRNIDIYSWKYCNKGFFNFKNYIPDIINKFNK